ncbi:MAG: hypothetical protein AABW49_03120 [Nanoarchaeota archaeon]
MIINIIIHIFAFTGLLIGFLIAHYSWEELKAGEKYFKVLQQVLLILIAFILFLLPTKVFVIDIIQFIAGIFIGRFVKLKYFYLGLASVTAILAGVIVLIASLIFLHGLPDGTMNLYRHRRKMLKKQALLNFFLYLLPVAILFVPYEIHINALVAGLILSQITCYT